MKDASSNRKVTRKRQYIDIKTGETFDEEGTGVQPVPADMPGVLGIFVGGCVKIGVGSSLHIANLQVLAHAHIGRDQLRG